MSSHRRRRPSAALIVALCALAVALVTPARAGSWLITSSDQIKPGAVSLGNLSARAKASLRGQRGPRGLRGFAGPAGAQGPAGRAGAQGPAGPPGAGVSGAAILSRSASEYINVPEGTAAVITLLLPAGSYAIIAKGLLNGSGTFVRVTCNLTAGGATTDRAEMVFDGAVSDAFTLAITTTLATRTRVDVQCTGGRPGVLARLYDLKILAIPVAAESVVRG